MSVLWMSDNRPAAADGRSLCKRPAGGNTPPAGRFRLWGDSLSLARRCCAAISLVEGMVRKWLVLSVCGALTLTAL